MHGNFKAIDYINIQIAVEKYTKFILGFIALNFIYVHTCHCENAETQDKTKLGYVVLHHFTLRREVVRLAVDNFKLSARLMIHGFYFSEM